jgi:hypothetical protein
MRGRLLTAPQMAKAAYKIHVGAKSPEFRFLPDPSLGFHLYKAKLDSHFSHIFLSLARGQVESILGATSVLPRKHRLESGARTFMGFACGEAAQAIAGGSRGDGGTAATVAVHDHSRAIGTGRTSSCCVWRVKASRPSGRQ